MTKDQYQGKAQYYNKYRPKFSNQLFNLIKEKLVLSKSHQLNRYLDLGCGTGRLTIPMSQYFKEVMAIDSSADMLKEAKKSARKAQCFSIQWIEDYAENLSENLGQFDLITIANAFHWMDHTKVVPWILKHLAQTGYLMLVGSCASFWNEDGDAWKQKLIEVVDHWFGKEKQAISDNIVRLKEPWDQVLIDPHKFD